MFTLSEHLSTTRCSLSFKLLFNFSHLFISVAWNLLSSKFLRKGPVWCFNTYFQIFFYFFFLILRKFSVLFLGFGFIPKGLLISVC